VTKQYSLSVENFVKVSLGYLTADNDTCSLSHICINEVQQQHVYMGKKRRLVTFLVCTPYSQPERFINTLTFCIPVGH